MQTLSCLWRGQSDLEVLVAQIPSNYADLLIQVFWGKQSLQEISSLQQQLQDLLPNAHVMGTTTAGGIFQGAVIEDAVIISLTVFKKVRLQTILINETSVTKDAKSLVQKLFITENPAMLLCFLDASINSNNFINAINKLAPTTPIAGGLAATKLRFEQTVIFDKSQICNHGIVATACYGKLNIYQGVDSYWQAIGPKFTVTKAVKNIIYEINNTTAIEFYRKYLGKDTVNNYQLAIFAEFPLMFETNQLMVARSCHKVLSNGGLLFADEIKQGQKVQFGLGSHYQALQDSFLQAKQLTKQPIETIFVYSCVARKLLLGELINYELQPLAELAPTNGFFTHGEIAYHNYKNSVFNQALTYVALAEETTSKKLTKKIAKQPSSLTLPQDFKSIILKSMVHLSTRLTLELENTKEKFQQLAEHDYLTGLLNRHAGMAILSKEIARGARLKTAFTVALLDLDNFKKINDSYGHNEGDEVLKYLAKSLTENLRQYDSIIRWGGEEFLIIFPSTSAKNVYNILAKVLKQFAQHNFKFVVGKKTNVTFSTGITTWCEHLTAIKLLKIVDDALYAAKSSGRNCLIIKNADIPNSSSL